MKIDIYQLELEQARSGKSWTALGIDRRLIMRAKNGTISPLGIAKIANALGVDPERIVKRGEV